MNASFDFIRPLLGRTQALLLLLSLGACSPAFPGESSPVRLPVAQQGNTLAASSGSDSVVFAGGCFWGVQAVFQHLHGVRRAVSGYAGGERDTAQYQVVSSGLTGHAESVEVTFDPSQISLAELMRVYFSVAHDPTQLNRQGPDQGSQYRSAIFYHDETQRQIAQAYISQLDHGHYFREHIVTQLTPLKAFYPAEGYHQDYATLHPDSPYIARFDLPKVQNVKTLFPELYRDMPVLVAAH